MRLALFCFGLMGVVSGCAQVHPPAGHEFSQAAFAAFVLDRTTVADVEAALGPPMKHLTVSGLAKPDSKIIAPGTRFSLTMMNYYFAPFGLGLPPAQHPAKAAMLQFLDGRLLAYDENSSVPGQENMPVDESRLASLRQSQTTRAETIALLGPPNGQALHVLEPNAEGTTEIGYNWAHVEGDTVQRRNLRISFDKTGRLSSYALVDNAFPASAGPIQLPAPKLAPPAGPSVPGPPPDRSRIPPADLSHT